jgi:hypothetical protein
VLRPGEERQLAFFELDSRRVRRNDRKAIADPACLDEFAFVRQFFRQALQKRTISWSYSHAVAALSHRCLLRRRMTSVPSMIER